MQVDKDPYRCDYLVSGLRKAKITHLIFIFFIAALFAVNIVEDLDQSDAEVGFLIDLASKVRCRTHCRALGLGVRFG